MITKPALDVLLNQNVHDLINCMAANFYRTYSRRNSHSPMISQEDLSLEGYVGMTIAYESFDPSLGHTDNVNTSFRTYIYPYVKNAMSTYCRKFSHSLTISEKSARDDMHSLLNIGIVHIDQFDDNEKFDIPIGSGVQTSEDMNEYFLAGFSQFERELVKDHMIDGYSLQEISHRHQISKSRAGEIIRDLTERLKQKAENYEND